MPPFSPYSMHTSEQGYKKLLAAISWIINSLEISNSTIIQLFPQNEANNSINLYLQSLT